MKDVLNGITVAPLRRRHPAGPSAVAGIRRGRKVKAMVAKDKLENINDVFAGMHTREIEGRIVLDLLASPNGWLACQAG